MKVALLGNSQAAIEVFELLRAEGHELFVVGAFGGKLHSWHAPLFEHAAEHGLTTLFAPENVNHPSFVDEMRAFAPDVLISVYYNQRVREPMLEIPRLGCVDFHASLLPAYRGSAPLIWAILDGQRRTGVTLQKMTARPDEGDVVLQRGLDILPDETGFELHQRAAALVGEMAREFLQRPEELLRNAVPQSGQASYHSREDGNRNQLRFNEPVRALYDTIRALAPPLPGAFSIFDGVHCRIDRATPQPGETSVEAKPGQIFVHPAEGFVRVRCLDGELTLDRVNFNGSSLSGREFFDKVVCKAEVQSFPVELGVSTPDVLAIEGGQPSSAKFIFFGKPLIGEEEETAVLDTLRSGWIGAGPKCIEFEKQFGRKVENEHAVAVSSCTAALHMSLVLLGVGPGHEVITTPLTFAATINVIEHVGATPVLADIDPLTWNIDPAAVEAALSERTRAIIPVHFGGLPCDMERLEALAAKHGLPLVEDAAHALGATCRGRPIGSSANLVCFSFYANKNLTSVEGGMLCCPREDWAARARSLRMHGMGQDAWQRFHTKELILARVLEPGFKYNLTDLQSAIGLAQLKKFDRMQAIRDELALEFDEQLAGVEELTRQARPIGDPRTHHALHLYAICLKLDQLEVSRNTIVAALRAENIGAGIHYEAIHLHPYYRRKYGFGRGLAPVSETVSDSILSLPLSATMTSADVKATVVAVKRVLRHYRKPRSV